MLLRPAWDRVLEIFVNSLRAVDRSFSVFTRRTKFKSRRPTYSWGRGDYDYWERLYYGRVEGLELSGLFLRPIVNKISAWTLGRPPKFQLKNKKSQSELESWWNKNHPSILSAYQEALKVGDCFVVINSDLSVTIVSADTVDPIVDPNDYSKRIGWKIRQIFPNPGNTSQKMTITDEYYVDRRIRITEFSDGREFTNTFPNLIGIVPVIHIANNPSAGEAFGHSEGEALIELLHRYGQVLEAAIEGNILQGRPTPVLAFDQIQDLNAFWRRYGKRETVRSRDGTVQEVESLTVDMSELLTVSAAKFTYESPGSFAEDTERLLGLIFYLILEHIELPEFVFGNAIEGSKSSAETQMPVFENFIKMRQSGCASWMYALSAVVLAFLSLVKPGVIKEDVVLQWAKITQNGRLTLDSVSWAYGEGLLDERLALLLLPLDVEKPEEVLKQAKKDAAKRKEIALSDQEATLKMQSENSIQPSSGDAPGNNKNRVTSKKLAEMSPELEDDLLRLVA